MGEAAAALGEHILCLGSNNPNLTLQLSLPGLFVSSALWDCSSATVLPGTLGPPFCPECWARLLDFVTSQLL